MHKSLFEVFQRTVAAQPDKVALIYQHRPQTYREIARACARMAAGLQRLGVQRGDRVVICGTNRPETVVAFWASLAVGATVAPITTEQPIDKIRFTLDDSEASAFIAEQHVVDQLQPAVGGASHLRAVIALGAELDPTADSTVRLPGTISEDLAALIYTSGSTGEPKGIMLTHANMLTALASLNEYLGNRPDDVFLDVLPLSFDYGLYQMIMAFSVGATLVLENGMLLPLHTLKNIERYRITVLPGVPVVFELFEKFSRFGSIDSSSVRYVSNTGAALLPRHIESIKKLFPTARIFSMYGLTECKRCTYLPPHLIDVKPASVGIAIPNTEIMVVDDDGRPCPPFQIGQLVVRGGTVMQGYWRRPEETARKLRPHPVYGGRALFTGDYGYLDEDNCFYFKGRMDEVIKVRGRKLIPREIEDALRQIEGVRDAVVICSVANDGEHHIAAFVEGHERDLTESALRSACRGRLENYQIPHLFQAVDRLPRNQNGKVDKIELRQRYMQAA
jgi:amino acid adenylation domain-containing protein